MRTPRAPQQRSMLQREFKTSECKEELEEQLAGELRRHDRYHFIFLLPSNAHAHQPAANRDATGLPVGSVAPVWCSVLFDLADVSRSASSPFVC